MYLAAFRSAYYYAEYAVSDLYIKRYLWFDIILPFINKYNNLSVSCHFLCATVASYLEGGWEIGIENPEQKQLNMETYDENTMDRQSRIEIMKDLTISLNQGKAIAYLGPIKGIVPLFIRKKDIDPISGAVLTWRTIRDCKKGSSEYPSQNDLTPIWKGKVELIYLDGLIRYAFIMYTIYGPGFYAAKTDLDGAFRQFWLAPKTAQYCVYKYDNKYIMDLFMYWGTRTGSKICQDAGQTVSRTANLAQNGTHLLNDINEAVKHKNILYFIKKMTTEIKSDMDREKAWDSMAIFHWDSVLIERWLIREDMSALLSYTDSVLSNGTKLLCLHCDKAKSVLSEIDFDIFKLANFFEKLILLKIESRKFILTLINNYIDDFLLFFPPHRPTAVKLFLQFCEFLNLTGLKEKFTKRIGPNQLIILTGFYFDYIRMKVYYPILKRNRIKELICKYLFVEMANLSEYESLLGKLNDVATLRKPARSFLSRLTDHFWAYIKHFGRKALIIVFLKWQLLDLRWWLKYMDTVFEIDILEYCDPFMPEDEMSFDGATNGSRKNGWNPGLGVWYKGQVISIPVPQKYTNVFISEQYGYETEYAIAHFEAIAIIVGLQTFRDQLIPGSKLTLKTDSMHVLGTMQSKKSHDLFLQSCMRWLCWFSIESKVILYLDYIHTKKNTIPDLASRFAEIELFEFAQTVCDSEGWILENVSNKFEIPDIHRW